MNIQIQISNTVVFNIFISTSNTGSLMLSVMFSMEGMPSKASKDMVSKEEIQVIV